MNTPDEKFHRMTEEPLSRLTWELAVPTVITMLVTAAYNMADTFFVGRIGTEATAGVGLILPVMTIIQAIGFFFGQGSGNFISRALGAKDLSHAERMASTGGICAALFGLFILAGGMIFRGALLYLLGARSGLVDDATVQYAGDYLTFILCGAPFMCLSCGLNNQLRFQGNAVFAMIGLVSGAVLNCVLDPIFIFVFDLEVKGAAMATMISQIVSCALLFIGTLRSDSLKIKLKNFTPSAYYLKNICIGGFPSLCRQALASLAALCLNAAAGSSVPSDLAEEAIAAFSIVNKIVLLIFSAVIGFGQGFQPICGFNYGAKKYDRVWNAYTYCLKYGSIFLVFMAAFGFTFAPQLVSLFRDDADVIAFGTKALRLQCLAIPFMAMITLTNMMYQSMGRVVGASVLAAARQGLVFIPAVLILPKLFANAVYGVYLAQPVADLCAFIIALPMAVKVYREFKAVDFGMKLNGCGASTGA